MEERIPRTAGNVYEKWDKDVWQVIPKTKRYTTFIDFENLTISETREDEGIEDISIKEVIHNIRTMPLDNEETLCKQKKKIKKSTK